MESAGPPAPLGGEPCCCAGTQSFWQESWAWVYGWGRQLRSELSAADDPGPAATLLLPLLLLSLELLAGHHGLAGKARPADNAPAGLHGLPAVPRTWLRYELWQPMPYYRGFHFWLDQF